MNPNDPNLSGKQGNRNQNEASGSELISYQPNTTPIDFTEFLNIDDDQSLLNLNGEGWYPNYKIY